MRRTITMALLTVIALLAVPSVASAGCITRLPARATMPSKFAAAYTTEVPITVHTNGPRIRKAKVELYTFSGRLLGKGVRRRAITSKATIRMKLKFGMQPGKYTLVVTGEPNANPSCGPKKLVRTVRFRKCFTKLPIRFPAPPGGKAADYEDFLSVPVEAKSGGLVSNLRSEIYSFGGKFMGRASLDVLFGVASLDHALESRLTPGGYTLIVTGEVDQPKSCGRKRVELIITLM